MLSLMYDKSRSKSSSWYLFLFLLTTCLSRAVMVILEHHTSAPMTKIHRRDVCSNDGAISAATTVSAPSCYHPTLTEQFRGVQ
uniref:Putative secreted protein n=1 Tax=Ixodes ricinus TaxID=34613 RepID=A0A6B0TXI1_IXORI